MYASILIALDPVLIPVIATVGLTLWGDRLLKKHRKLKSKGKNA